MAKKIADRLREELTENKDALMKCVEMCDGHTIFKPSEFTDMGLPVNLISYFVATHKPGGSPKGSIFTDEGVVDAINGVYGLDFLYKVARIFDVKYTSCLGRGFQARAIQSELREYFSEDTSQKVPQESKS